MSNENSEIIDVSTSFIHEHDVVDGQNVSEEPEEEKLHWKDKYANYLKLKRDKQGQQFSDEMEFIFDSILNSEQDENKTLPKEIEHIIRTIASDVKKGAVLKQLFNGVCIFVNGLSQPPASVLRMIMQLCGGQYSVVYEPSRTTHTISANFSSAQAKSDRAKKTTVTVDWILDSIKEGRLLNTANYLIAKPKHGVKDYFNSKSNLLIDEAVTSTNLTNEADPTVNTIENTESIENNTDETYYIERMDSPEYINEEIEPPEYSNNETYIIEGLESPEYTNEDACTIEDMESSENIINEANPSTNSNDIDDPTTYNIDEIDSFSEEVGEIEKDLMNIESNMTRDELKKFAKCFRVFNEVEKMNLGGSTSIEETVPLVREWILSSDEPQKLDMEHFFRYLCQLINKHQDSEIITLLKAIKEAIFEKGSDPSSMTFREFSTNTLMFVTDALPHLINEGLGEM